MARPNTCSVTAYLQASLAKADHVPDHPPERRPQQVAALRKDGTQAPAIHDTKLHNMFCCRLRTPLRNQASLGLTQCQSISSAGHTGHHRAYLGTCAHPEPHSRPPPSTESAKDMLDGSVSTPSVSNIPTRCGYVVRLYTCKHASTGPQSTQPLPAEYASAEFVLALTT